VAIVQTGPRVLDVLDRAYKNGAYVGLLAVLLRGTKVVFAVGIEHCLEVMQVE
jgi:hypothetical protein